MAPTNKWRVAKRIPVTDKWFYYDVTSIDEGRHVLAALGRYNEACGLSPTKGKVQAFSEKKERWIDMIE